MNYKKKFILLVFILVLVMLTHECASPVKYCLQPRTVFDNGKLVFNKQLSGIYNDLFQIEILPYIRTTMLAFRNTDNVSTSLITKNDENDIVSIVDFIIQMHITKVIHSKFSNIYVFGEESLYELFDKIISFPGKKEDIPKIKALLSPIFEHFFLDDEQMVKKEYLRQLVRVKTMADMGIMIARFREKFVSLIELNDQMENSKYRLIMDPLDGTQDFMGKGDNPFENTKGMWYSHATCLFEIEQDKGYPLYAALESPGQNRRICWYYGDVTRYTEFDEVGNVQKSNLIMQLSQNSMENKNRRLAITDLTKRLNHKISPNKQFLEANFGAIDYSCTGGGGMQIAMLSYLAGFGFSDDPEFQISLYLTSGQAIYDIIIGAILAENMLPVDGKERVVARYWDIAPTQKEDPLYGLAMPAGLTTGSQVFPVARVYLDNPYRYRAICLGSESIVATLLADEKAGNSIYLPIILSEKYDFEQNQTHKNLFIKAS